MKKKSFSTAMFALALTVSISSITLAASSTTWKYTEPHTYGTYVPDTGSLQQTGIGDPYKYLFESKAIFYFSQGEIDSIKAYMQGGVADCGLDRAYITLDQTAIPDSNDLEIDGHTVITNLPNPKVDIESNFGYVQNNETEVVALSLPTVSTQYYMKSYWNDLRDGDSGDSGSIQAQFAMSRKGFSDYNNCMQSTKVQATITYGDNYNQP